MGTVSDDEAVIASIGPQDYPPQCLSELNSLMEGISITENNSLPQPVTPAKNSYGHHLLSENGNEDGNEVSAGNVSVIQYRSIEHLSPLQVVATPQSSPGNPAVQDNAFGVYVQRLESRYEGACQEIQRLSRSEEILNAEMLQMRREHEEELSRSEATMKQDMFNMKREISHLRNKNMHLRDVILKSAGTQKVTDEEVTQAFYDLRQSVQQLASSSIFDLTAVTAHGPCARHLNIRSFYKACRGLRGPDIAHRVKAEIFASLHHLILNRTCFGLKRANSNPGTNENLWDMDESLVKFEQYLMADPKGKRS